MTGPPIPQLPPLLSLYLGELNPSGTAAYTRRFVAKVSTHPLLQGTWTKWSGSPDELSQLSNELEAALLAAEGSGSIESDEWKLKTALLKKKLAYALMHTEMVADSDPAVLTPLNLKMRQTPTVKKGKSVSIDKAPHLTVTHSESTALLCKVTRPPGAAAFQVQITEDPSSEANWVDYDTFLNITFKLTGRVPGKTYFVRVRGKGRNGETGPWSNIVSIIAL